MKKLILLITLLIPLSMIAQIQEEWASTFDLNSDSNDEFGQKIVLDSFGNSYITGAVFNDLTGQDFITIKYDSLGQLVWQNQYNGAADSTDLSTSIQIDGSNNIYVAGYSYVDSVNIELIVIKYDNDGTQLWLQNFSDWIGTYMDMAVSSTGEVYIAGNAYQINPNNVPDEYFTTLKFSAEGDLLWANYDVYGTANAIHLSPSQNLYVSGPARDGITWDYLTIKYNSDGTKIWENRWGLGNMDSDWPRVMTIDDDENVYISGRSDLSGTEQVTTIKYDSSGNQVWLKSYPFADSNLSESIKVDSEGNFYLLINSVDGNYESTLKKFDGEGDLLWSINYLGPYNFSSRSFAMALDQDDNIYVAGYTLSPIGSRNCVVLKYNPDGIKLWEAIRFNTHPYGRGGMNDITIDQYENVFVTGAIDVGDPDRQAQIITIKYSPCLILPTSQIIGPDTICANDLGVEYAVQGSLASSFQWLVGGGEMVNVNGLDSISINWSDGGSWPNSSSMTNLGQGLITVFETDPNGCIANPVSKWVSIETCTSVHEAKSFVKNFSVYPNPSSTHSTIEFDLTKKQSLNIQVHNSTGQRVYHLEKTLASGNHKINLDQSLVPGMYFLTLTTDDMVLSKKLIKN